MNQATWGLVRDVLAGTERWCVLTGDGLEVMRALPAKSVAHVLTDPPYEAAAHTTHRRVKRGSSTKGARWGKGDDREAMVEALGFEPISESERAAAALMFSTVAQRWQIVFCQIEAANAWSDALRVAGSDVKRIGVWVKPDAQPQFTEDRPGMGFETLVFGHARGRSRWNGGGRVGVFTHTKSGSGPNVHPTQKPLRLMLELVDLFTDPGDVILDPYGGSGSTAVAALRLGRRCIIVEKDPAFAEVAEKRIRDDLAAHGG